MAFQSGSRSSFKALASTAAGRAPSTIQPRFQLPSLLARSISQSASSSFSNNGSHPPSPPSSNSSPSPTRITFEPNFFSSLTTIESVQSVLRETKAFTTDSSFRPDADRREEALVVAYLTKASKMDDEPRNAYLKVLDQRHRSMTSVEQDRMEKAKEQVLKGLYEQEDSISMEEWDEERRKRKEFALQKLVGRERRTKEVEIDKEIRKYRRRTLARREVKKELEEEEKEEKADEDGENSKS
ncbi:hypothetical protein BDY24DRAFT_115570 [Mrakia frigida]|uniref:uncharacterized protein n=1 Tax=Mrakia frigida TaxID=29902 RepID=UPI003FCC0DDB